MTLVIFNTRLLSVWIFILTLYIFLVVPFTVSAIGFGNEIFARTIEKYAALNSYSDTGKVINEYGKDSREEHKFTTCFSRAPRGYYFDFNNASGDRFVIWSDPNAFHTWWKEINSLEDFPNPDNTSAFVGADVHSVDSALKIVPLLYPKARMQGALTNFSDITNDGNEAINGHQCYRLVGTGSDVYANTGNQSNIRKVTLWIDMSSSLIIKIVELPKAQIPGQTDRITTIYEPLANPAVDQNRFKFTKPVGEE